MSLLTLNDTTNIIINTKQHYKDTLLTLKDTTTLSLLDTNRHYKDHNQH